MDQEIFLLINSFAGRNSLLDILGIFFAVQFIYLFGFFIGFLWVEKRLQNHVYLTIASSIVARVIVEVVKQLTARLRPYEFFLLDLNQLVANFQPGLSFPSGHAVIFFSFAFSFYDTKYFKPFFVLACIGSGARIFVGLHYPSDIFVGAIIGAGTTLMLKSLFKKHFML